MKINLLLPLILMLVLIPISNLQASHDSRGAQEASMPVQHCFRGIELYRALIINRAAGMTLEETRIDNDFSVRILIYIAANSSMEYDENIKLDLDAKTLEIYELPDPQYLDIEWQIEWAKKKFNECIAEIPNEFFEPSEPQDDQFQRMIPDLSA